MEAEGRDAISSRGGDGKMGSMETPFSGNAVVMILNAQKDETTAKGQLNAGVWRVAKNDDDDDGRQIVVGQQSARVGTLWG